MNPKEQQESGKGPNTKEIADRRFDEVFMIDFVSIVSTFILI